MYIRKDGKQTGRIGVWLTLMMLIYWVETQKLWASQKRGWCRRKY